MNSPFTSCLLIMKKNIIILLLSLINLDLINSQFIIETTRLKIRPFNNQDSHFLYPLLSDPEVMAHSRDGALDIQGTKKYLTERIIKPFVLQGFGRYALFRKDNENFIGFCGLTIHKLDDEKEYIELGYKINKNFWNQGYASESALVIKEYARDVLGLKDLISIIEPSNHASIRVAEKVGLKFWKKSFFNNEIVNIYRIIF